MRKGLPGQSFIFAGFILPLPRPDSQGSEHMIHRERPVATQHSLRNCVDRLAALSHAYDFDVNLAYYRPYPPVKEQRFDNLPFFSVPWRFCNCYGFFLVFEILNFRQNKLYSMQYTRFPKCTINKPHKLNSSFCSNPRVRSLLINSHEIKHEITRNSRLILKVISMT